MSEGDPRTQIREAAVWSLGAFRLNLLAFLVLSAIVAAVQFMQQVSLEPVNEVVAECANPESPGQQAACASELPMRLLTAGALTLVFAIAGFIVTIGVIRGALRATRGQTPAFDALLDGQYLGRYLGFQVLYALLVGFGALLCLLPGLLVIFFFQLGPYYVLDRGMGVRAAFAASASTIRRSFGRNAAAAFTMTVLNALVLILGGLFFGLLTLLILPFASLFTAYLYRLFNDEPVLG